MLDLAPITRILRAKASSYLLVSAVFHLKVFEALDAGPLSVEELKEMLKLKDRPAMVLFPALCAMELLAFDSIGRVGLTALGKFLTVSNPSNLIGYVHLEKDDAGVKKMTEWLLHDGPADTSEGFSFVKDDDAPSPMDEPETARFYTMALAGRAKYLAPVVAEKITRHNGHFLDIAGGTGYYTYEWLLANPNARATLFDRPEVLKVAEELLADFCSSGREGTDSIITRLTFLSGDMLVDELPKADIILAASVFHDWPADTCQYLSDKFANALNYKGEIWIHDAFLHESLDGPLAVTDYSAMLFLGTKGRAYSRKEYREWFIKSGLKPGTENMSTSMDYGLINAIKS